MYVSKIKIYGFGKLKNFEMDFSKDINIIYGPNESGKSTILAFIKACLYGLSSRGVLSERTKYAPWDNPQSFGGEMFFEFENKKYRLTSTFGKSKRNDEYALYNETTGEKVAIPSGMSLGEYIFNLSEGAFDSSIFAPQLQSKIDASRDKDGQIMSLIAKSQVGEEESINIVERRLENAMGTIKAPRSGKGILDKLYALKKENDAAFDIIKEEEKHLKEIKTELESLVSEKEKIDERINFYHAKERIRHRNMVFQQMSKINNLQEAMQKTSGKIAKSSAKTYYISTLLLLVLSGVLYFLPIPTPFAFIPVLLVVVLSILALRQKRESSSAAMIMMELKKEAELLEYMLQGKDLSEHEKEWKKAEEILRNSKGFEEENIEVLVKRREELTRLIAFKTAQIQTAKSPYDYSSLLEEKKELEEKITYYEEKYQALQIAYEVIRDSYSQLQTLFGPKIADETGKILKELTNSTHDNVRISKDFDISVDEETGYFPHQFYSGGTIDQLFLAFRLAVGKTIVPYGALPLYLDDPFVQYDDERLERSLNYLKKYNSIHNNQIILTACHKRILPHVNNIRQINVINI
ncbi:MAG: AAA family ATPase [Clostridiaceae bacterium]|nr:AAA family ATPase [Clostridiaceae bacterium]